jgi:hypothetical protein
MSLPELYVVCDAHRLGARIADAIRNTDAAHAGRADEQAWRRVETCHGVLHQIYVTDFELDAGVRHPVRTRKDGRARDAEITANILAHSE